MKKITLYIAAVLIALPAMAQNGKNSSAKNDNEKALLAVHASIAEAYIQENVKTLDEVTSDDFLFIGNDGKNWTKQELQNLVKDGKLHHDDIQYEEVKIRIFDNTAIVTGIWHAQGSWQGEDTQNAFDDKNAYTFVYVKQQGKWKIVSAQFSLL